VIGNPTPAYRLEINGQDLTARLASEARLSSLTITETRGEEADQLDLTLSDHDGRLALPKRGQLISAALGWKGSPLVDKGRFKIDEVEHAGAPDTITIRARSADFTDALRVRREGAWKDQTLGDVLQALASRNGLQASVAPELASVAVGHLAQSRESDANLLTRLGRQYDAAATVKAGRLIFSPIGRGSTASGLVLPTLTLTRGDGDGHRFKEIDREAYGAVSAAWHDTAAGERKTVTVGDSGAGEGKTKRLRRTFASEADARSHAEAERNRLARAAAELSFTLALGRPELYPEQRVKVLGIKPEIDAAAWLIKSVTHTLTGGLTTSLELETG